MKIFAIILHLQWLDAPERYGIVSRLLHWGMAFLILWQFAPMVTSRVFGESAISNFVFRASGGHLRLGTAILLLVIVRGAWALVNIRRRRRPHKGVMARIAIGAHLLLYALMFAIPALAYLRRYGRGWGLQIFGVRLLEPTGTETPWMVQLANLTHGKLAWLLAALIAGHIVMALVHRFVVKDYTLSRMALWSRRAVNSPNLRSTSLSSKVVSMTRIRPPISLAGAGIAISFLMLPATMPDAISGQDSDARAGVLAHEEWQVAQADSITVPTTARPEAALPNGATSINEIFGDWTVNCSIVESEKACVFSQAQGSNQTGQRSIAIELRPPKDGLTEGVLLMPFGLKLADGVKLKIDDQNLGQGAQYSMCVPQGCLVPVSFPTVATDAMKRGTTLTITATNPAGDQPVDIAVPLAGFTAAMNRIAELAR